MPTFFALQSRRSPIVGGSKDPGFPGWIDVKFFRWHPEFDPPKTPGKRVRPLFSIVIAALDSATPALYRADMEGTHFETGLLDQAQRANQPNSRLIFDDVVVNRISASPPSGDEVLLDVWFSCATVKALPGGIAVGSARR